MKPTAPKILKTVKLFIGGEFPRSESGRSYAFNFHSSDKIYANISQASRKDLRAAVEAAEAGNKSWSSLTAYNRAQVLYRMAEMTEGKRHEFVGLLKDVLGLSEGEANTEVDAAIDSFIYFAGFADKFQQVSAAVNPVAGPHHNFTTPDPVGVTALICESHFDFGRLVAHLCPILASGNSVVALLSNECPAILQPLAEVFATSDLPKGAVNLLTGDLKELYPQFGSHMEIRSISVQNEDEQILFELKKLGASNMKRLVPRYENIQSLKAITNFVEFKTVWHPIGT